MAAGQPRTDFEHYADGHAEYAAQPRVSAETIVREVLVKAPRFLIAGGFWAFLFYIWVVGELSTEYLFAGCVVAFAAALAALVARSCGRWQFGIPSGDAATVLLTLPGKVLRDFWLLLKLLYGATIRGARPVGVFKEVPFVRGGNDPKSATRRALVEVAISTPPNEIAICVKPSRDFLLVHQLVPRAGGPAGTKWPL